MRSAYRMVVRTAIFAMLVFGLGLAFSGPAGFGSTTGTILLDGAFVFALAVFLEYLWRFDAWRKRVGSIVVHRRFPDPTDDRRCPTPGDGFERYIDHAGYRERVAPFLADHVRRILIRDLDFAPDEAAATVASGAWTDDPVAAAFVAQDARLYPRWKYYLWQVAGGSPNKRAFRRAAEAIRRFEEDRDVG